MEMHIAGRIARMGVASALGRAVLLLLCGAAVPGLVAASEIEEILVTAEKRVQSAQDVPIAITAFSQDSLDKQGIEDIWGVAGKVPSLHLSAPNGVLWAFMRGTGNSNPTAGGDNSVAFHFDGVYLGLASAALTDIWDIDRVEVLRGPQGTLYGRNATGGSINIVPNRPSKEFEAFGDLTLGDYNLRRVRGVVNPGGNETLRSRVAFEYTKRDGYQKNLVPGHSASDADDSWMVRVGTDFTLSDSTELQITLLGAKTDAPVSAPVRPGAVYPAFYNGAAPGVKPTDPRQVRKDLVESNKFETYGATANLSIQGESTEFRGILAYYDIKRENHSDWDGSEVDELDFKDADKVKQTSLELQLMSKGDSRLEWIVGAYAFGMKNKRLNDILVGGFIPVSPFPIRVVLKGDLDVKSYAVFGQASYRLSDDVKMTLGVRRAWDHKQNDASNYQGPAVLYGTPIGDSITAVGGYNRKWGKPMGKFSVDWAVTKDNLLYGTFSRGYKSGGFQAYGLDPADGPGGTPAAEPETVNSFEVGSKNTFLDNRVQLNVAAFVAKYNNIQQINFVPGSFAPDVANIAGGTAKGVEIDWIIALPGNGQIDGGFGYIDTAYDSSVEYDIASCSPLPPFACPAPKDIKGNQFVSTPTTNFNLGAQYTFGTQVGDVTARVDLSNRSRTYYSLFKDVGRSQKAYTKLDARLMYQHTNGWNGEVYVDNITNENVIHTMFSGSSLLGSDVPVAWYAPPRTFGVRVGYHF